MPVDFTLRNAPGNHHHRRDNDDLHRPKHHELQHFGYFEFDDHDHPPSRSILYGSPGG